MEFWEACENYIQGNIETAVDDRRHDPIEHLAIAMSVPDLLSEVSKKSRTRNTNTISAVASITVLAKVTYCKNSFTVYGETKN